VLCVLSWSVLLRCSSDTLCCLPPRLYCVPRGTGRVLLNTNFYPSTPAAPPPKASGLKVCLSPAPFAASWLARPTDFALNRSRCRLFAPPL
jgi:hypothetical protein